jgi:rRNA-processing protein FCF1
MTVVAVLDNDAVAWLARQPSSSVALGAAVVDGRLRLLIPAAIKRQVEKTPDAQERARRLEIVQIAETVSVPAAIGSWVIGTDHLGSAEDSVRHDRIRHKGSRKNANKSHGDSVDALLVAAALDSSAAVVTLDGSGGRSGLIQRAREEGCPVISPAELLRGTCP